ncbi:hypothetical protein T4E_7466 [Trichinella pseudospiralis]|uniref:Uncharacterized protein n=1 Tax=Trichinella pseudospiralis TaxID=6337 RepID=A0A0V0Y7H8_TRIPS|nr:hypothetical protein T4E_7466 [Trichinella pseudospiralis]
MAADDEFICRLNNSLLCSCIPLFMFWWSVSAGFGTLKTIYGLSASKSSSFYKIFRNWCISFKKRSVPSKLILLPYKAQFILYSRDSFLHLSNESPLSRLVSLWRSLMQNFHRSKQQTPQIEYNP